MHHHAPDSEGWDHTAEKVPEVTDLICGMTVDPAKTEHRMELHGELLYFCSAHCRSKLEADLERYRAAVQ